MNCAYIEPYILLKHLGEQNYKVLVTHHADVTITANCDHAFECNKWKTGCGHCETNRTEKRSFLIDATHLSWSQMKNAFAKVKQLYASGVSEWMTDRVRQSPFFTNSECRTILSGREKDSVTYRADSADIRSRLGIKDNDKVIIHVTPNFSAPIKGGRYVIELAKRMPEVKFIVVGIKKEEIQNLPNNIIPISHTSSKTELAKFYSLANATVLTSYRESFSMVTAESLCCGTPVVGFKAGAPETIAIPEYSKFVDYGDILGLEEQISLLSNEFFNKRQISNIAREKYNAERMYREYLDYYNYCLNA